MSCLGLHLALTAQDVQHLLDRTDEPQRLRYFLEVFQTPFYQHRTHHMADSGKAWDTLHRALADGTLDPAGGTYPLNHAVLGGTALYAGEDFILSLKSPEQVVHISAALEGITEDLFRERYLRIDPEDYGMDLSDDDQAYTWESFEEVRALYRLAAEEGLSMLFSADQ